MKGQETVTHPVLWVQPAPHVHVAEPVTTLVRLTLLAAAIPGAAAVAVYGLDAVRLMAAGMAGAAVVEAACEWLLRRKALATLADGSALVTGLLLALTLPPTAPTWMALLGAAAAIALGKYVFGGLGHNLFNPALVGHVFLLGSFAPALSGGTASRPALMAVAKAGKVIPDYLPLLWHAGPGPLAAASPLAVLVAGVLVMGWGAGRWQAPAGFFVGSGLLAMSMGWHPAYHWLVGLAPLTVAFFVNDPPTTPVAAEGRFVFGLGAGALTVLLRLQGSFLEGAAFAVLVMNALTPLLNRASVALRRRHWRVVREAKSLQAVHGPRWRSELQAVLVLVLVTSAAGVLLASFYHATAPLIASQQQKREIELGLKTLMPEAVTFNRLSQTDGARVFEALDAQGNRVGYGVFTEGQGYHDVIRLAVGIDPEVKELLGVRVLQQSETPGLGSRIEEEGFLGQFAGKSLDDAFMPGEDVDGISGATVSSVAVCDIVVQAIEAVRAATEGR
ncbi:MAG: RnfABCDGE type electron transport complex subunit D [Limnochordaceae bacterium]|nr:RnfABCDGE type electron transport complex subunit D [Limnochordaceae bacterium]